jgi:hypothetical protein
MEKPRVFLGSSGKLEKLLEALTRGLGDIARVEPWTTSSNPGVSTLGRDDASRADLISRKLAEWRSFRKVLVGADG